MSNETKMTKPGWGKSPASRKWHYFHHTENGLSLCGGIGFYFGPTEEGGDTSPDNCAKCRKGLIKLREVRKS